MLLLVDTDIVAFITVSLSVAADSIDDGGIRNRFRGHAQRPQRGDSNGIAQYRGWMGRCDGSFPGAVYTPAYFHSITP